MQGIEILNKTPILEFSDLSNTLFGITIYILIASLVLLVLAFVTRKDPIFYVFALVLFTSFILIIIAVVLPEQESGRYTYQCKISEEVSLVEFYEKYEIADKNGDLWAIRERKK